MAMCEERYQKWFNVGICSFMTILTLAVFKVCNLKEEYEEQPKDFGDVFSMVAWPVAFISCLGGAIYFIKEVCSKYALIAPETQAIASASAAATLQQIAGESNDVVPFNQEV